MNRGTLRVSSLLGLLWLLVLPPAWAAQETASGAREGPSAPAAAPGGEPGAGSPAEPQTGPAAIPASRIPRLAVEAVDAIRDLRRLAEPDASLTRFEARLAAVEAPLRQLRESVAAADPLRLSPREVDEYRVALARQAAVLGDWIDEVEARAARLEWGLADLAQRRQVWTLTRDALAADASLALLDARAGSVLDAIAAAEFLARERLAVLLTALDRIAAARIAAREIQGEIRRLEDRMRRGLLAADNVPLWRARGSLLGLDGLAATFQATWHGNLAAVRAFLALYAGRIPWHGALIGGLVLLFTYLRRRSRRWDSADEDAELHATLHVLEHPFSSAAILGAIAALWFYPEPPLEVVRIIVLGIVVPIVRVLVGLAPAELRLPLRRLAAVYVVGQLHSLLAEGSLLRRVVLLGVSIAGAAVFTWGSRAVGAGARQGGRGRALIGFGARAAAAGLAISAAANVLGNLSLASLLTHGSLGCTFVALILLAGNLILRGMINRFLYSVHAERLRSVRGHRKTIRRHVSRFVNGVTLLLWAGLTLQLFGIFWPAVDAAGLLLQREWTIGSLRLSLGDAFGFVVVLVVSYLLSRVLRFFLEEQVFADLQMPRGIRGAASMLVHYCVLGLGFLLAVSAAGIEWSRVVIVLGALGVGIGFGLQGLVNNIVSGLILIFERPIQVGDTVEVGALIGEVRRIGMRASVVRTYDGAEVVVPNGNLLASEVVNWTLSDQLRRIEIPVGVAYGTDVRRVQEVLERALSGVRGALRTPEPAAHFQGFGDSSLNFRALFWTDDFEGWQQLRSEAAVAVSEALRAAGIEIPFPQRDLHLRSVEASLPPGLSEPRPRG